MAQIVSQRKIFVDIPAPFGISRQLFKVKSIDIKDGKSAEVVMAIGVSRGAGIRRKQGGFEIDMTAYHEVGKLPEVDWRAVNDAEIIFTLTTQDEGNGLRQAYTCTVSKVDDKGDEAGVHEDTITLVATQGYHS